MKTVQRVLLTSIIILTIALAAVAKRKDLLEWAAERYARDNGLALQLSVTEFTPRRLLIHGIRIGGRTFIPELDIEFHSLLDFSVKSVRADLNRIDLGDFPESDPEKAEDSYFQTAALACRLLQPLDIDLSFGDLQVDGFFARIRLHLKKRANSPSVRIERKDGNRLQKILDLHIACGDRKISMKAGEVPVENIPYRAPGPALGKSTTIKTLELSLDEKNAAEAKILITGFSVDGSYPVQASEVSLNFSSGALPDIKGAGTFHFRDFQLQNEKGQKLAEGLRCDGRIAVTGGRFDIGFRLRNRDGGILVPETAIEYLSGLKKAKVSFSAEKVGVDSGFKNSFPVLKQWIEDMAGEYSLTGRLFYEKEKIRPDLRLQAFAERLKTASADLAGARLDYRIGPTVDTGRGKLEISAVRGAARVEGLVTAFQMKNPRTILIENVVSRIEGADLTLTSFELDLKDYSTTPSQLRIDRLSLEKILKLFLKETVTADGLLSGGANFYLKKGLPVIADGRLKAVRDGWIRYRPPGAHPPPEKETLANTATPIEILNHYLYNFSYQNLEMDFSTDENLVLRMTLRALGNNPPYRQGQALKLNVSLQENLLPVVKSVLLTQQLPEKLKKKMQTIGN